MLDFLLVLSSVLLVFSSLAIIIALHSNSVANDALKDAKEALKRKDEKVDYTEKAISNDIADFFEGASIFKQKQWQSCSNCGAQFSEIDPTLSEDSAFVDWECRLCKNTFKTEVKDIDDKLKNWSHSDKVCIFCSRVSNRKNVCNEKNIVEYACRCGGTWKVPIIVKK